jgi:hypothetical protein
MPFPIDQQIRDRIKEFVAELDGLVRQAAVESVAQALGDGAPVRRGPRATHAPPAAARTRGRGKGQKRDPQELEKLTQNLFAYVSKNSGQRIEQIAKGMGTTTKELALPAKKLIAEKKIRTKGQRRATSYFTK